MRISWDIRQKLNAQLTLIGLIFIAFFAPLLSYLSFTAHENDARAQQARLVGAVATSASIAVYVGNEEIATEVLEGLLQDDEIIAVELRGADGFSERAQNENVTFLIATQNTLTSYPLSSPVDANIKIGELNVWSNDALINERSRELVYTDIGFLIALTILIAGASMFVTNSLVGKPLKNLANQVAQAKPDNGDTIQLMKNHEHDEIGLVVKNVNTFLSVTKNALDKERDLRTQIEKMNQHFSNIFASSHVGVMVTDDHGLLLHYNPVVFERLIKLSDNQRAELASRDIFSLALKHPDKFWSLVDNARRSGESAEGDLLISAAWHSPCWAHCIVTINRDEETKEEIIEIVLYDVTRRVLEAKEAQKLAERDPLTNLLNRRGLESYLEKNIRRPEAKVQVVLMLLDLDGFKPVNDTYGHNAGDEVLKVIAKRLRSEVRSNIDQVARIGGDEFVVLIKMRDISKEAVASIAQKMITKVGQPIGINPSSQVQIGVSVGIAYARDYSNEEALIEAADDAMYRIKMKGKNDFAFAS